MYSFQWYNYLQKTKDSCAANLRMSLILSKFPGRVAVLTGKLNANMRELLPLCIGNFNGFSSICQVFSWEFTCIIIK